MNVPTFEPYHQQDSINENLKYSNSYLATDGKPYNANLYWKEVLQPNLGTEEINNVPIVQFLKNIISHN